MIKLNDLHIKNFFSFKESTLDFNSLEGLILLEGVNRNGFTDSNGAGKSSVLESIVYTLTGNTIRNVGVNDMINRLVGKNTMCKLSILNNNVPISIIRYRKDDKNGDSLVLIEDGKDISSRLNKSTQETLDRKLGVPYKVLVNTILLGEGLSSKFTQLSDPEKKSLIESTLSLSYDVNSLRDKVNSYIKELKLESSSLSGSIKSMQDMIDSFKPTEITGVEEDVLNNLNKNKESISEDLKSLGKDLDLYNIKIKSLEDAKLNYENYYKEYTDLTSKYNDLYSKLNSIDLENPICHLCGQPLNSEESKNKIKASYTNDINNIVTLLKEIESELKSLPEYSIITSKLSELQKEKLNIDSKRKSIETDFISITKEIASLESKISHNKSLLENIENYKIKLLEENKRFQDIKDDLQDYDYLYKLFSPTGLIIYILQDAVSYINDRLKIYSEMLIDKVYKFELSKGKLCLLDSTGSSYQSLSNGEKRRLDICIQFSLHDYVYNYCGLKLDFCFIDEILDALDATGVDNIFEVLRLKMDYCRLKGVIVITHNSNLKDKFDKIITVEKDKDGYSKIL